MVTNGGFDTNLTGWSTTSCSTRSTAVVHTGAGALSSTCNPAANVSQTITGLTVGETYTLSYWLKDSGSLVGQPEFTATLGGVQQQYLKASSFFDWTQYTFNWTATATSALLNFNFYQNRNGSAWSLDDVSLIAAPQTVVSEPGSLLLLGLGAMMFGVSIRERARSL
jgi:hypothetical protein